MPLTSSVIFIFLPEFQNSKHHILPMQQSRTWLAADVSY
jgi:hypothetical protein